MSPSLGSLPAPRWSCLPRGGLGDDLHLAVFITIVRWCREYLAMPVRSLLNTQGAGPCSPRAPGPSRELQDPFRCPAWSAKLMEAVDAAHARWPNRASRRP